MQVAKNVVARHGKHLTLEVAAASLGKRPLEAWQTVADMLGIDQSAHDLFEESEKILIEKWVHWLCIASVGSSQVPDAAYCAYLTHQHTANLNP